MSLHRALEVGGEGYTEEDVLAEVRAGKARVFFDPSATMIVETDYWDQAAHIWLAGGELKAVLQLFERVEEWAKSEGFHLLTIEGRSGWKRYAPRYGYEVTGDLIWKALR